MPIQQRNTGVTLIELMVALAISSVMMLGIGSIFFSTKRGYQVSDEFAQLQENGRYAMEVIQQAVRDAGNTGCGSGSIATLDSTLNVVDFMQDYSTGIVGFEYTAGDTSPGNAPFAIVANPTPGAAGDWTGPTTPQTAPVNGGTQAVNYTLPGYIAALAVPGSDILVTRTLVSSGANVMTNNDADIIWVNNTNSGRSCTAAGAAGLCAGDVLMISDCTKSLVFQATGFSTNQTPTGACAGAPANKCIPIEHTAGSAPGNISTSTSWGAAGGSATQNRQYGPGSEILRVESKIFFVGVPNGGNAPSLYTAVNGAPPQPLVDGIENLQVLYGVDTDADGIPNQYLTADQVENAPGDNNRAQTFENVVSTRISLIARTPDALPGVDKTAALVANPNLLDISMISADPAADIVITAANDNRMRKVFDLTVELRNRASNIGL